MNDNDNNINSQTPVVGNPVSVQPTPLSQPAVNNISTPPPSTNPQSPSPVPPKIKKSHWKLVFVIFILIVLFGASTTSAFYYGKSKRITVVVTPSKQPINLPPDAIVTSECTPGRGKQYIIPKDIPGGPIYDVRNSEVIAIEYVLGLKSLVTNSDVLSNTILNLTSSYPVDHFTVVPVPPKPGDTDQFIHLIMFVVSKSDANKITCAGTTSPTATTPST